MVQVQHSSPADAYQEYFGPSIFQPLARVLFEHATPEPGDRVLDVACGTGIVTRHAASMTGAAGRVVGVDVNPAMIAVARAQPLPDGAPIEWRQGDGTALDLPGRSFDLVYCQQGLQFFPDRSAGAHEMRRVLTDAGRVAIAVWEGLDRHPLYEALADAKAPYLSEFGANVSRDEAIAPFSFGDADELHAVLTAAGFRGITITARSIEARFATPERFVERMEFAYAAVVPQFAKDPAVFAAYLDAIARETKPLVERYRDGDRIVVPMYTHVAVAHA